MIKIISILTCLVLVNECVAQDYSKNNLESKTFVTAFVDSSFFKSDTVLFIENVEDASRYFLHHYRGKDYLEFEFKKRNRLRYTKHQIDIWMDYTSKLRSYWNLDKLNDVLTMCIDSNKPIRFKVLSIGDITLENNQPGAPGIPTKLIKLLRIL